MWWFCDARFNSCLVRPPRVIFFLAAFPVAKSAKHTLRGGAVWSARRAHNPKVGGSNPPPATTNLQVGSRKASDLFLCLGFRHLSFFGYLEAGNQIDAYEYHRVFLHRGRVSYWCAALCGTCHFAIGCPAAGRRSFPVASLLSTLRCLATRSTGAFSCRRSRCLGRRLLPPSVVLAGRGSLARGVPRG